MIKLDEKFISWYEEQIDNGYKPYLNIKEIEKLINKIVTFYIENYSSMEDLLNTLSSREKMLFESHYKSYTWTKDQKLSYTIKPKEFTYQDIMQGKTPFYKVYVNPEDGKLAG